MFRNIEHFNRLRKKKCKLGFTFVLTYSGADELSNINEFADRFDADGINLSQIIPCELIENLNYNSQLPIGKRFRVDINEKYQHQLNYCPFDGCCFIKWNGDVVPCMQLLHRDEYKNFRKRVKNFEFPNCTLCDGCDDRKENETDCMYNEMPTCGACLWAQNIERCP